VKLKKIVREGTKIVASLGINTVIGEVIKFVLPDDLGFLDKALVWVGKMGIYYMVDTKLEKEIEVGFDYLEKTWEEAKTQDQMWKGIFKEKQHGQK
jgi:hypothetical protein